MKLQEHRIAKLARQAAHDDYDDCYTEYDA